MHTYILDLLSKATYHNPHFLFEYKLLIHYSTMTYFSYIHVLLFVPYTPYNTQAEASHYGQIYMTQKVSTILDKKGAASLLYQVVVESKMPDEFQSNMEMAREVRNTYTVHTHRLSYPIFQSQESYRKSTLRVSHRVIVYNIFLINNNCTCFSNRLFSQ